MSDYALDKLASFLIDIEDEAKSRHIDAFSDIPQKTEKGDWHTIVRFTVYAKPPDLSIHVTDGIGSKDKIGGK